MLRCAIYLRVSKDDDSQTTENQLLDLDEYAEARGWHVTERYVDRASGGKGRADRAAFDRMMGDAGRRQFVITTSPARTARSATFHRLRLQLPSPQNRRRHCHNRWYEERGPVMSMTLRD